MKNKKWLLPICIVIIIILFLAGVLLIAGMMRTKDNGRALPENPETVEMQLDRLPEIPCNFNAQYIRTDNYDWNTKCPVVKIIRSVDELNSYYETNKDLYDLKRRANPDADSTIGFLDACDKYDKAYFENQILVMVVLGENSGLNRHEVRKVGLTGETMNIEVDSIICMISSFGIVPGNGTDDMAMCISERAADDMAMWHILIEPEAGIDVKTESDVTLVWNGTNMSYQPAVVKHSKGYADISLELIDGWEYQIVDSDENANFRIEIRPVRQDPQHQGKIEVCYSNNSFGVCGTGLEQEKIKLGDYEAYKGIYDNKSVWDFIYLIGTPGDYYILNSGDDAWWEQYGDQAMQILGTIVVGKGILTEVRATKIAETKVSIEYNKTRARFDAITGNWTVLFCTENTVGGDQTVIIDSCGNIIAQTNDSSPRT